MKVNSFYLKARDFFAEENGGLNLCRCFEYRRGWVHAEELKTAPPPFAVKVEIKPATAPQTSNTSAQKTATQAASKAQPKAETAVKKSTEKKIGVNIASRILTFMREIQKSKCILSV